MNSTLEIIIRKIFLSSKIEIGKLMELNKKIGAFSRYFEGNMASTVLFLFVVSLVVRFLLTDFNSLLREDAYVYLLKSIEIARGNFIPIHTHAIGLSLFATPVFYFFGSDSIFQNMVLAKIVSIFIGSSIIFPFYLLLTKLANKKTRIIALVLFAFYSSLIVSAGKFLSEPLFTFLFLFSVYFIISSLRKKSNIVLSFLFAGLAYYVRPNGIFIFIILIVSFFFLHYKTIKKDYKYLIIGILIFWIIAFPFLCQRYSIFGSAFTYGENDKYLVDSYQQVWSNNVETPSLKEYLSTHGFFDIYNKFVIHGFLKILFDFLHQMSLYSRNVLISPFLIIFFCYSFFKNKFRKEFIPLYVSIIVFIAGLSIVYDIFGDARHFLALAPIFILFSAIGVYELFKKYRLNNALLRSLMLLFIIFNLILPISLKTVSENRMGPLATWAADNLQGKIGVIEGGDMIMMNLPDTSVAGVGQLDLYAKESNLSVTRPGYFKNLTFAMAYFKKIGMTYLVLDKNNIERRPYLKEVYLPKNEKLFTKVYSCQNLNEECEMNIFKINWDKYGK